MRSYVELCQIEPGTRFRFHGTGEVATLVEKGAGRAIVAYEKRAAGVRTFAARDRHGQVVTRTIPVHAPTIEPCALGAQVVPLAEPREARVVEGAPQELA